MSLFPQKMLTLQAAVAEKTMQWRRPGLLLAADLAGIFGTALILGLARDMAFPHEADIMLRLLPLLALAPIFFYIEGLYDYVMPPFPQELRRIGMGISLAYLALFLVLFLTRTEHLPSRMLLALSWMSALALTPYLRTLVRRRFAGRAWWGKEVVIFGPAETVGHLIRYLRFTPEAGLRPAAAVCPDADPDGEGEHFIVATLPRLTDMAEAEAFAEQHKGAYAIILGDAYHAAEARALLDQAGRVFPCVFLLVGYMGQETPLWLQPVEIAHTMGLRMRQNLLDPRRLALKRCLDLLFAAAGFVVLLPLFAAIAIWIRWETPGPIFYAHKRIGMHGRHFTMLKFRTMVRDADSVLAACLERDPDLRREWDEDQKLRLDPRITRAGRFLRRLSLDELPQILNVLKGDMSLVGPRPIVDDEVARYGPAFEPYVRVRPGMTGLWQVSGRNDTSYAYRVGIDVYYICNWSLWMDVWILARTPLAVFRGEGAY